jgi:tRNA 2-thiouridine synthesizing protein A
MMADQSREEQWQQIGRAWIQAISDHEFEQVTGLCQADVHSRLVTPKRFVSWENTPDLVGSIRGWFEQTSHVQIEDSRIDRVGQKLAINYRLRFQKDGEWLTAEQQVYGFLENGLFTRLDLLCSGFQPVNAPVETNEDLHAELRQSKILPVEPGLPVPDASLMFTSKSGVQGLSCSLLTPAIKARLSEIGSGQVLEVRVDDPEAKGDIESWCRLSGNELLAISTREQPQEERGNLWFYLKKK